jgi:hypothetical protein
MWRVLSIFAFLSLSACGPQLYRVVDAPHPLRAGAGRGAFPEVSVENNSCTDQTGLREACTSVARLTRATAREVCAAVTLGENAAAPRYVDRTRFVLVSSTGKAGPGEVRGRDDRPVQLRGSAATYHNVRAERGMTAVQRRDHAQTYRWIFATREVCFANLGVLTPATTWMEVQALTPDGLLSWGYRWRFPGP